MVLPDILNFVTQSSRWIYSMMVDFIKFVSDTFPFTSPGKLLLLSMIMLASILGLFMLFGGHGIGGSEWGDGSRTVSVGATGDDFTEDTGLLVSCEYGNVGDIDCDEVPDDMDNDIDGDGVSNDDDDDPYGADDTEEGGTGPGLGDDTGAGITTTTIPGITLPRCGDNVCSVTPLATDIWLGAIVDNGNDVVAASKMVFCGIPSLCIQDASTDEDYSRADCPYGETGTFLVIVGEANVYNNLNEYCELHGSVYEDWDSNDQKWVWKNNFTIIYSEGESNCPGDCDDDERPDDEPQPHCENFIKDQGEEGVDCGGSCPRACGCFTHQDCVDKNQDMVPATIGCLSSPISSYSDCPWATPGYGYDEPTAWQGRLYHCCDEGSVGGNSCASQTDSFLLDDLWGCFEEDPADCNPDRLYRTYNVGSDFGWDDEHEDFYLITIHNVTLTPSGHDHVDTNICEYLMVYSRDEPAPVSVNPQKNQTEDGTQVIFNYLG